MELKTNYCAITLPLVMLFIIIYQELGVWIGFLCQDFFSYIPGQEKSINSEMLGKISKFHLFFWGISNCSESESSTYFYNKSKNDVIYDSFTM